MRVTASRLVPVCAASSADTGDAAGAANASSSANHNIGLMRMKDSFEFLSSLPRRVYLLPAHASPLSALGRAPLQAGSLRNRPAADCPTAALLRCAQCESRDCSMALADQAVLDRAVNSIGCLGARCVWLRL